LKRSFDDITKTDGGGAVFLMLLLLLLGTIGRTIKLCGSLPIKTFLKIAEI
jgi:hypothetical protein